MRSKFLVALVIFCVGSPAIAQTFEPYANVSTIEQFGGVSGTDNTTAIQAALAACTKGQRVTFPSWQVKVLSGNLTIPQGCTFGNRGWVGDERSPALGLNGLPSLLLNPSYTINCGNAASIDGLAIFNANLTAPTSVRNAVDQVFGLEGKPGFTGTAITVGAVNSCSVRNVYEVGFTQCYTSTLAQRPNIQHFRGDCTAGIYIDQAHDVGVIEDIEQWPYFVQNSSYAYQNYAVSNVQANAGGIEVTIPSSNILIAGDTVEVFGVGGFTGANNRWVVTSVDGSGDVFLTSSQSAPTTTGTWTNGSTHVAVASLSSLGIGQAVSGTGIAGGSTIVAIDYNQSTIILSAATTASGSGASLSFTNGAYTASTGTLQLSASFRTGIGIEIADSQGVTVRDAFDDIHDIKYANFALTSGGAAYWTGWYGVRCGASTYADPFVTCMNWSSPSGYPITGNEWIGGWLSGGIGTMLYSNTNNAAGSGPNKVIGVGMGISPNSLVPISHQSGSLDLVDVDVNASAAGTATPYLIDVSDSITALNISTAQWNYGTLSFNSATSQALTIVDAASRFLVAPPRQITGPLVSGAYGSAFLSGTNPGLQVSTNHGACASANEIVATGASPTTSPQWWAGIDTTNNIVCANSGWAGHANPPWLISAPTQLAYGQRHTITGNYSLTALDAGAQFDNAGSGGTDIASLPVPTSGLNENFCVIAAQTLEVLATSGVTINVGGSTTSAGGNVTSAQPGACISLQAASSTLWLATNATGSGGSTGAGGWTVH